MTHRRALWTIPETSCFFPGTGWCPDFLGSLGDLRMNFVTIFIGKSETIVRVSSIMAASSRCAEVQSGFSSSPTHHQSCRWCDGSDAGRLLCWQRNSGQAICIPFEERSAAWEAASVGHRNTLRRLFTISSSWWKVKPFRCCRGEIAAGSSCQMNPHHRLGPSIGLLPTVLNPSFSFEVTVWQDDLFFWEPDVETHVSAAGQ